MKSRAHSHPKSNGLVRTTLALVEAARPKQWLKNALLFVGLVFAVRLGNVEAVTQATLGFLAFCGLSSSIYFFNDLADLEQDRQHPKKKFRPLASGRINRVQSIVAGGTLLIVCLTVSFMINVRFGLIALGYVLLNVAYNAGLKNMVIVDVFILATFFVIRTIAGAVAIHVPISPWLYLCTILAALFLGLAKRRHELLLLGEGASSHRLILREYSAQMLEQFITIVTASLVMAYSLYTFSAENLPKDHSMMITIPIVIFGIFRYLFLVHRRDGGGSPEDILLADRPLIVTVLLLGIASVAVIYLRGR